MDAQCGWCYGNSANMSKLTADFSSKFNFEIVTGGMWLGQNTPKGGENLSAFLQANAPRMSATTGATIGEAFYSLANDSSYAFSSLEPDAAITLVKAMAPERVFEFAKQVQRALYVAGKRLDETDTYIEILDDMGLSKIEFLNQWMTDGNIKHTKAEFEKAKTLAQSFPTLLLHTNGKTEVLASGYFNYAPIFEYLNNA